MTIDYETTPADLSAWFRFAHSDPAARRIRRRDYLSTVGLAVLAVGVLAVAARASAFAATTAGVLGGLLVLVSILYVRSLPEHGGQLYAALYGRVAVGRFTMILAEDGIREKGRFTVHRAWSGLEAAFDTPEHLFLSGGALGGFVIPKRAFRDGAQVEEFKAEVTRYAFEHSRVVWTSVH